jgi:hypothetical protein
MLLRFVTGVTGHIETFIVNNYNKVLFQPVTPVTLFSNENTPGLKLALSHVPRTQIRGPSVSDRDPLAKLLKLLLTFVTINTHIFERSGMERFKN